MGALNSLMVTMKGLPMTYNRDMQEDKVPLFEAADEVAASLQMACVVVQTVKLNTAKPAAAAEESWVIATDLAEALARSGTPFHQAHQIVGKFVLESVRAGKKPSDWTAEEMRAFGIDFPALSDPRQGMQSRELPGGTGPKAVAAALAAARERLNEMNV
jgi:argininosuccinate lyase